MFGIETSGRRLPWRGVFAAVCIAFSNPLLSIATAQPVKLESSDGEAVDIVDSEPRTAVAKEALLLSGTRQLTFEGRRAGEGYFSKDGSQLVFQSERESGNPFFQIYVMDRATGDVQRISPGHGKTTWRLDSPEWRQGIIRLDAQR